jgi:hypothetical protein
LEPVRWRGYVRGVPDHITPDTKDWTWVLEQPCPECGFDSRSIERGEVPALIRENADSWREPLERPDAAQRPASTVWSPVEYACHVRDVHALFDERLAMMLTQHDPTFPNWDQDDTAVEQRYHEQDPAIVLAELQANAQRIARDFEAVAGPEWDRTGRRSDGAVFTVDTFARYYLHDIVHHIHDVTTR